MESLSELQVIIHFLQVRNFAKHKKNKDVQKTSDCKKQEIAIFIPYICSYT